MQTQQQMPSSGTSKTRKRKQLPWGRLIIAGIALAAAAIGIVLGVLDVWGVLHIPNDGLWSTTFFYIILPVLGIVLAVLQWILPIDPRDDDPTLSHPAQPVSPQPLSSSSLSTAPSQQSPSTLSTAPSQQSLSTGTNAVNSSVGTPSSSTGNVAQPTNSMPNREIDFFISYADADIDYAKWIAKELEGEGYSTFLRAWDFEPGSNFVVEMNDATKVAKRTLLLLSPDYLKGSDEHPEWTIAFSEDRAGRQRKLLPIYVRECKQQIRGLLGPIVPIDIAGKDVAVARDLLLNGVQPKNSNNRRPKQQPGFPGQP